MKKISIVGVEGSGKTVLMTVLGDKYKNPDQVGLFLYPKSQETVGYVDLMIQLMRRGEWPSSTVAGQSNVLGWGLFRENGDEPTHVCDFSFLDFSGEVYRLAFGSKDDHDAAIYEDQQIVSAIEQLKNHISISDTLLVLVNLKDYLDGDLTTRQARETRWLSSQGIVDYATQELKLPHIALVFTQTDAYRAIIASCGGVQGAYRHYFPHVAHRYPKLPVFAVSAVDGMALDADGLQNPSEGFHSEGLDNLMEWIVSTVPGYETLFATARIAERKAAVLPEKANLLRKKYKNQFHDAVGRRETLRLLEQACEQLDAALRDAPKAKVDADDISSIKKDLAKFHELEKAIDSVMAQARQCDERETRTRILRICDDYRLDETARDWLMEQAQDIKLKAQQEEQDARQKALQEEQNAKIKAMQEAIVRRRRNIRCVIILALLAILGYGVFEYIQFRMRIDGHTDDDVIRYRELAVSEVNKAWENQNGVLQLPYGAEIKVLPCEPGTFTMGSASFERPKVENQRFNNETRHTVKLTQKFWLGECEVTQEQYESVMEVNPATTINDSNVKITSKIKIDGQYPVINVTWEDAMAFCQKVNDYCKDKLPYGYEVSLPTEAQWEYAAKAGTTTIYWWGNDADEGIGKYEMASYIGENASKVKSGKANPWGFFDMLSNVSEWCFDSYTYTLVDATDPVHVDKYSSKVIRGGNCWYNANYIRPSYRTYYSQTDSTWTVVGSDERRPCIGFRIAVVPKR